MDIKKSLLFVTFLLFQQAIASSEIIQTDTIDAVIDYVENPTDLIVFDLDETLITLEHGEHWIGHLCKHYEITEFKDIEVFYIGHAIQDEQHLLEAHAPHMIAQLQQQGNIVLALTARSTLPYVHHTYEQLLAVGINFSHIADNFTILAGRPALHYHGIISSGDNNKGEILMRVLDYVQMQPTKIIFIDDKLHHLEAMRDCAYARGIPFVGLHIKHAQSKCAVFSEADHKNYVDWLSGELVFG